MARPFGPTREVERGDQRIVAAKEKKRAQEAQDKVAGKRPGRVGTSGRAKKRKIAPLRPGSYHVLKLTGSPQEAEDASNNNDDNTKEVNSPHSALYPHLKCSLHSEHSLHFEDHTEVRTSDYGVHLNEGDDNVQHAATGAEAFVSTFEGSGRHIFPGRNIGGDEGANLRTHLSPPAPFVPSWGLTTSSILNDVE
ncbi:hypothetical protein Tco_0033234 [Tanacetum coccineum]